MANNNPKLSKPIPNKPSPVNSTNKVVHPAALKVDERTALDFSELLQRRSENEKGMERDREMIASTDKGRVKTQKDKQSVQQVNSSPNLFFQAHSHQRNNIIEDVEKPDTQSMGSQTINAASSGNVATVNIQDMHTRPAVERVVETVYRDWQSHQAAQAGQKWAIQLSTGGNTTSQLEIEYTASGEWLIRISDDSKSNGFDITQQDIEESMDNAWDHQQFCLELEACLKENRPDLSVSVPTRS